MKTTLFFRTVLLAGAVLAVTGSANAQDSAKPSEQKAVSARQQKPAAKPHKVWTDDDLGSLHRSGGLAVSSTAAPEASGPSAADSAKPPAKQVDSGKADSGKPLKDHPPLLSNPKTPADADGMIAWEQRDIDSQQEYVDRLQTELEQAPPERREHLQSVIAERQQVLADTRREQQQLIAQKKTLEKKSAGGDNVAAATQP
jgi:hypothetical protein